MKYKLFKHKTFSLTFQTKDSLKKKKDNKLDVQKWQMVEI